VSARHLEQLLSGMPTSTSSLSRRNTNGYPLGSLSNGLTGCFPTDMPNGIHDYLKFIAWLWPRHDHPCKDIRGGLMTREQGIEMVRKYDHVAPA
jgi:hypothetical protein